MELKNINDLILLELRMKSVKTSRPIINSNNDQPTFSVITVVRNGEDIIENTILSVINQNYLNLEYIIIDGNSTDRTIDIIQKYEDKITFWISEPDMGIYDAMNKGISKAKGKFVNFMNAGDIFFDSYICQLVAEKIMIKECDVIYGDFIAQSDTNNVEIIVKPKSLDKIWMGMIFCHQSVFIKVSILKEIPFDLKYKIVADYNQILSMYINNKIFCYMPNVIAKVAIGGVSYSNYKTIIEQIKVIYAYRPYSLVLLNFILPLIQSAFRTFIGIKMTSIIREYKWKYFYSKTY